VLGIPYDSGQTFATGSRFAPHYIRLASDSIEEFSIILQKDVREADVSDWGDLIVSHGDFNETKRRFHETLEGLAASRYVFIGGDHTITIFSIPFLKNKVRRYVHLDAHADFEDSYLGSKYNHDCVLRRVGELLGWDKIVLVGLRSVSKKGLKDLKEIGIEYYTSIEVEENPEILCDILSRADYISIDMDVFDPAYAPEVGNPEPLGLSPQKVFKCIKKIDPVAIDITEAIPTKLNSQTAILAASLLREIIIVMDEKLS